MGLFNAWNERKRIKVAAEQMWDFVKRGYNFEVPLIFDKNDLTLQAIAEMSRRHPQVEMRMYQSKGLVVGLFRAPELKGNHGISGVVLDHFAKSGNIEDGYKRMQAEDLLARHEAWLISQKLDPKEQERLAQEDRMKRERIELSKMGEGLGSRMPSEPVEDALDTPVSPELKNAGTEAAADGAAKLE